MAVSVTSLSAPTNVIATTISGGSLTANTTYYYKIVAVYSQAPYLGLYGARIISLSSAEVSVTTDSTNKQVSFTWDAVSGATGYEIYRTEISGDYSISVAHRISPSNQFYALTTTNSAIDTGAYTLIKAILFEKDYPMAIIDGGTEASPYTEDDVYNALVSAGFSSNCSKITTSNYGDEVYWLNCSIIIRGWFRIRNFKTVYHEGTVSFGSSASCGWLIGEKTSSLLGAVYIRSFLYQTTDNYTNSVIKWYNSTVIEYQGAYTISFERWTWGLVWGGSIYIENCTCKIYALQISGSATGKIANNIMQWSMQGSSKITNSNLIIPYSAYGVYAYYATENTYFKDIKFGSVVYDIFFHKDATPVEFNAINHTFNNNPPICGASNNPSKFTVNKKYEFYLRIVDENGDAISGATVKLTDNASNEINPENSDSNGDVWITSGTATSATSSTLVDTSKTWEINVLADYLLQIYSGTGSNQELSIKSNTANTITLKGAFETTPTTASKYRIVMLPKTHKYVGKATTPYYDLTTYGPFILTISKSGYETYTSTFDITGKLNMTITLKPIVPIRQTLDGELLLANQPETGSSAKLLKI